jgi:hypothetical protein
MAWSTICSDSDATYSDPRTTDFCDRDPFRCGGQ